MTKKHQNEPIVRRAYETRVSADPETHTVVGMPVVFDSPTVIRDWWSGDEYTEIIARDALANTDMSDVLLCVNHEYEKIPLARSKNGKGTLSLEVTDTGLSMRASLDTERNPEAAALYSAIERGDITGMSFMFRVRGDSWQGLETDQPIRTITDISIIHEVSAVNDPAYPQTSISARSSEETEKSVLEEARARLHAEQESEAKRLLELEKEKNKVRTIWI